MSFIKANLDDVKEPTIAPEGEYDLRVVRVNDKDSKKGNPMTEVFIAIEGGDYQVLRHYINYPRQDQTPDQKRLTLLDIKRFLTAFEVPMEDGGFETEDLNGATARMFVTQEDGDDGNTYNRLRLPRIKD